MLEMLKIISYIVWIGVGITSIGGMLWGFWFYSRLWSKIVVTDSKKDEVSE